METMARRIRFCLPEVPLHVVQRGNNRQVCFFRYEDRQVYLNCLSEYARETGCALHAYVLMSNHVHLLLTPRDADSASRFMKRVGQRYVQYVNRTQGRSGGLWEGRFRSCLVEEERYLLNCYRYIELNPVRAGMVSRPEDYPWSSHVANIGKHPDPLLDPHPLYLELGREVSARQEAYRALFQQELSAESLEEIRAATHGNRVLGTEAFQDRVDARLTKRAGRTRQRRAGRRKTGV
jgi:putative transposase